MFNPSRTTLLLNAIPLMVFCPKDPRLNTASTVPFKVTGCDTWEEIAPMKDENSEWALALTLRGDAGREVVKVEPLTEAGAHPASMLPMSLAPSY